MIEGWHGVPYERRSGAPGRSSRSAAACGKEAAEIEDLYLDGKEHEAAAAVPDELLEATSLCGPESYVRERIAAFAEAGVTHLQITPLTTGDQTPAGLMEKVKTLMVERVIRPTSRRAIHILFG